MGYRGDFYIRQNIIGYTGNINHNPTIYFQDGTSFGHITQEHAVRQNVGREEVRQAQDYEIRNYHGRAQEWAGGRCFHESRNAFISVANLGHIGMCMLALGISKHKEKKQWGDLNRRQQELVLDGKIK